MGIPLSDSDPGMGSEERETGLRHSFANGVLMRSDHVSKHPSGAVRILEYPTDPEAQTICNQLAEAGILLGHQIETEGTESQTSFMIPPSSRPIIYDSRSAEQGAYSYGDDQLFFDLGELLARAYQVTGGRIVASSLSRSIGLVEFTRPEERRLFLVPGTEKVMTANPHITNPLDYYTQVLQEEFASRFRDSTVYFQMGFNEANA